MTAAKRSSPCIPRRYCGSRMRRTNAKPTVRLSPTCGWRRKRCKPERCRVQSAYHPALACGGCVRDCRRADEHRFQRACFDRFLQDGGTGVTRLDLFGAVAGDEYEGDMIGRKHVGQGIDQLAAEIDVEHR